MNIKNNKNYQNSQEAIRKAFFSILEEKGTKASITVAEICRKAGINRSTFYRHYVNVQELSEDICIYLQASSSESRSMEEFIYSLLSVIDEHRLFFAYYLNQNPNPFNNHHFVSVWEKYIVPIFHQHGVRDRDNMKYYFTYTEGGLISVLNTWIQSDFKKSRNDIYKIISRCTGFSSGKIIGEQKK